MHKFKLLNSRTVPARSWLVLLSPAQTCFLLIPTFPHHSQGCSDWRAGGMEAVREDRYNEHNELEFRFNSPATLYQLIPGEDDISSPGLSLSHYLSVCGTIGDMKYRAHDELH